VTAGITRTPIRRSWPLSARSGVFRDTGQDARQLRQGIEDNLRSLRASQLAAVNLRLPSPGRVDARFDDQLAAMTQARDEGLIAGVGLSNISLEQLRHAADRTEIACVQNLFHLADRSSTPVLQECLRRGIAFVPFCPLGLPRGAANPVLTSPVVIETAARLGAERIHDGHLRRRQPGRRQRGRLGGDRDPLRPGPGY